MVDFDFDINCTKTDTNFNVEIDDDTCLPTQCTQQEYEKIIEDVEQVIGDCIQD